MHHKSGRRWPRRLLVLVIVLVALLVAGAIAARHVYNQGLGAVSNDPTSQVVTIKSGSTTKEIGDQLEQAKLIRSAWAFELYIHSKDLGSKLQAGTYAFSPSEGTASIVKTLTKGTVQTNLVTILPGRRIDQVKADLINDGFLPDTVDRALDPAQYADLPVMSYKPTSVNSLEGLLYPDSYQRTADTDPSTIIRESLTAMGRQLTPEIQAKFAAEGLTTYQGIILASMVEKEVSKPADRTQVAQVFISRLSSDATAGYLGSDVTAFYGAILAGQPPSVDYDSAYNTYKHTGLPPAPISSISNNALEAAANPATTDWLYFVAGDDGNTYFSKTAADHDQLVQQHCHQLCGRP